MSQTVHFPQGLTICTLLNQPLTNEHTSRNGLAYCRFHKGPNRILCRPQPKSTSRHECSIPTLLVNRQSDHQTAPDGLYQKNHNETKFITCPLERHIVTTLKLDTILEAPQLIVLRKAWKVNSAV